LTKGGKKYGFHRNKKQEKNGRKMEKGGISQGVCASCGATGAISINEAVSLINTALVLLLLQVFKIAAATNAVVNLGWTLRV
jgi:hypothetical protein